MGSTSNAQEVTEIRSVPGLPVCGDEQVNTTWRQSRRNVLEENE